MQASDLRCCPPCARSSVDDEDDATAVTAVQLRAVAERLVSVGQRVPRDSDSVIVMDAGYDVTRLAWVLRDLPVELVGWSAATG
ncbi:hypothetical protein QA808_00960 [Streptomyces sp. B21-089]